MTEQKPLIELIAECLAAEEVELPPFDQTSLNIRNELAKDNPRLNYIESQVIRDQAITSRILRLANSSFYRGMKEITTVKDALVRLGGNEVANIVALATQADNFKAKDPAMKEFMDKLWVHSVACAVGANWIAKQCGLQGVIQEAFFAGLLHDVGKLFLYKVIADMIQRGVIQSDLSTEFIEDVVQNLHTEQGGELLARWNLPESYRVVAVKHHGEKFDDRDRLLTAVRLANKACHKCGFGCEPDTGVDLVGSQEAAALELTEVRIAELEIKLEDTMELIGAIQA